MLEVIQSMQINRINEILKLKQNFRVVLWAFKWSATTVQYRLRLFLNLLFKYRNNDIFSVMIDILVWLGATTRRCITTITPRCLAGVTVQGHVEDRERVAVDRHLLFILQRIFDRMKTGFSITLSSYLPLKNTF